MLTTYLFPHHAIQSATEDTWEAPEPFCPLKEADSRKIPKLTVKVCKRKIFLVSHILYLIVFVQIYCVKYLNKIAFHIQGRLQSMKLLESALLTNFTHHFEGNEMRLSGSDYEPNVSAVELEFEIFSTNRLHNVYK